MAHTTFSSTDTAPEKGSIGIKMEFTDEDGDALTPKTLTWTLTNRPRHGQAATVINSREDVAVVTPSSTETVTLSGNDLAFLTTEEDQAIAQRVFTAEFTYDSNLGTDLPGKAQYIFILQRLYVYEA